MREDEARLETETLERLRRLLDELPAGANIPDLHFYKAECSSHTHHCFDEPLMAITIQGHKHLEAGGGLELELTPGSVFVCCVDLPCASAIVEATVARPFLSLALLLNRKILADILAELPFSPSTSVSPGVGVWVNTADAAILDAFYRLAALTLRPNYAPILAPLIVRELHFLLLASPQGAILRDLYMQGTRDGRIVDTIAWLKQNVSAQVNMERLAHMAHMSVSSFHRHFKALTGLSPLQYHKKLRLHEARRLMLAERQRVSEAALAVGYESISQFNREYRRMFGEAPRKDVTQRLQNFSNKGDENLSKGQ